MEDRKDKMIALREKGLSYQAIGKVFGLSRARIHQLVSGYARLNSSNHYNGWYKQLRVAIFERDKNTCQKCGATDKLIVHHIDGNDRNNELSNLITLCSACHIDLHREGELLEVEYMTSKEIRTLRKRLGLTQKELAARVKVDAITVSRWERGEQRPSNHAVRQLARLVNKTIRGKQ